VQTIETVVAAVDVNDRGTLDAFAGSAVADVLSDLAARLMICRLMIARPHCRSAF